MASYSVTRAKTQTLAAATADTVTLGGGWDWVEVKNHGSARLSFRVDGTAATVDGDECSVVGPGESLIERIGPRNVISLISSAAVTYTVAGVTLPTEV